MGEQQLTEALNSLEQQRLLRNKAEEKLRENEELSVKTRKMALHMDDIENKYKQEVSRAQSLESQLSEVERTLRMNDVNLKNMESKVESEMQEKDKLSIELAKMSELTNSQRSSNFAMSQEIESLGERIDELEAEKGSLQNQVE